MKFLKKLTASLMMAGITIPAVAMLESLDKQLYTAVNNADLNSVIDLLNNKGANPDITTPDSDVPLVSYAFNVYLSCMVPEYLENARVVAQEVLKKCKNSDVLDHRNGRTVLSTLMVQGMSPSIDTQRVLTAIDMSLDKVNPFVADADGKNAYDLLLQWINKVNSKNDSQDILLNKLKTIKISMENNHYFDK